MFFPLFLHFFLDILLSGKQRGRWWGHSSQYTDEDQMNHSALWCGLVNGGSLEDRMKRKQTDKLWRCSSLIAEGTKDVEKRFVLVLYGAGQDATTAANGSPPFFFLLSGLHVFPKESSGLSAGLQLSQSWPSHCCSSCFCPSQTIHSNHK